MKTVQGPSVTKLAKVKTECGEPIEDQGERLKRWAEHYSKLYTEDIPEHTDLDSVLPPFDVFVELNEYATEKELSEAIVSLSNGKAPSEDDIHF